MNKFFKYFLIILIEGLVIYSIYYIYIGLFVNKEITLNQSKRAQVNIDIDIKNKNEKITLKNNSSRILCVIVTTHKSYKTKANMVHSIWAHKCDQSVYVTAKNKSTEAYETNKLVNELTKLPHDKPFELIHLDNFPNENYSNLTLKLIEAFKYIYKNENNQIHDYDWLFKADDDSFVIVENLRKFLNENNVSENFTYGYTRKGIKLGSKLYAQYGFNVGGAGYLISKKAIDLLVENINLTNNTFCSMNYGYEDVEIADCLQKLNIKPGESRDKFGKERFHSENYDNHWELNVRSMLNEPLNGQMKLVIII